MAGSIFRSRKKYFDVFQKTLSQLNPAQKKAVEKLEGPVLVIAGPGTGKTHLLAARIGYILLKRDVEPDNILCLTFTEAGVFAMKQRLKSFIGPAAHRAHVFTFHGFCNKVIQENIEFFGQYELEPISDLERIELIRDLLDELPATHPLRHRTNSPYFYETHLKKLFQQMKSEAWTPEIINQAIEEYLNDLPNRDGFFYKKKYKDHPRGSLRIEKIQEQERRMKLLRSASQLFPVFQKKMIEANRYDFDDMIQWVVSAFENDANLLRHYQEQYQYFLVDEYQDTNGLQNKVLLKLADYWDEPNLFVVGDDDQSIYEFQGARLRNLLDLYYRYQPSIELVVLEDNYRSTQDILDSAKALIEQNDVRIVRQIKGLSKNLVAQRGSLNAHSNVEEKKIDTVQLIKNEKISGRKEKVKLPHRIPRPQWNTYETAIHEAAGVVDRIERLLSNDVVPQEIAILYAKHQEAELLQSILSKKNINYSTRRALNVLTSPLVEQLRSLLSFVVTEIRKPYGGDYLLYRILHYPFFNVDSQELAKIGYQIGLSKNENETTIFWRKALLDVDWLAKNNINQIEKFTEIGSSIEKLIKAVQIDSPLRLIEKIISNLGIMTWLLISLSPIDQKNYLGILNSFMLFVRQEVQRYPTLKTEELLDRLEKMDTNNINIPLIPLVGNEKAVQLMTAHSAKGLEFEHVFVIDILSDRWENIKAGSQNRFSLPDTLTFSNLTDEEEARRRLLYVALTRAKNHLYLSHSINNEKGKPVQHSKYLDEIAETYHIEPIDVQLEERIILNTQKLLLTEDPLPKIPAYPKSDIDNLIQNFQLSVSSLHTYLRCKLSFFYEYVLRLQIPSSEAAAYGTAMHGALCQLVDGHNRDKDSNRILEKLKIDFKLLMDKQRASFSKKTFPQRIDAGLLHLEGYFRTHLALWPAQVKAELNIRSVTHRGVPITGSIDRIDFLSSREVIISDYKTGSRSREKVRGITIARPHGGDYWRQLYFYKILLESYWPDQKVVKGKIEYLESDLQGNYTTFTEEYKEENIQKVSEMIVQTYDGIQKHDFYTGCGESNCSWCNFLNGVRSLEILYDRNKELLDD